MTHRLGRRSVGDSQTPTAFAMSWIERPNLPLAQFPAASGPEHADGGGYQRGSRDSHSRRFVLRLEPRAHLMFIEIPVKRSQGSERRVIRKPFCVTGVGCVRLGSRNWTAWFALNYSNSSRSACGAPACARNERCRSGSLGAQAVA
jgi:hypothetical protein